ncbi:ribbon-helix-helix protein, CopG family [Shewanella sp. 10N.286.51.B8]|uniref:ribbon-helix-helix protein, CopG family n=1 Tax=Shewanella sp. 10N.286.51.B8 TaxID=3229708 RepID=UPI00354F9BBB
MGTFSEIANIPSNLIDSRDRLIILFKEFEIYGVKSLVKTYKSNNSFQKKWNEIWRDIAVKEGGKVSLTTVGIIVGSSLGGVGIAAMGSAVGLPLAGVLGLTGFISGAKIDSLDYFSKNKSIEIKLSSETIKKIQADSEKTGLSINELIEALIEVTYK